MNKFLILLLGWVVLVEGSWAQPILNKTPVNANQKLAYWAPVFSYSATLDNKGAFIGYEKKTKKVLDSIFATKSHEYQVAEKLTVTKKAKKIRDNIKYVFNKATGPNDRFPLPKMLSNYSKQASVPYVMLLSFKPSAGLLTGSLPYVRSSLMEVVVIDTRKEAIIFYGKSYSGTHPAKNYRAMLLSGLKDIYSKLGQLPLE